MAAKKQRPNASQNTCLSPEAFSVLRGKATEPPFTGKYLHHDQTGDYTCADCGNLLFSSDAKYDSGSGWPSFFSPVKKDSVAYRKDTTSGMVRTEVVCGTCGGHLGHVFTDGPAPTGFRFCINSAALGFAAKKGKKSSALPH